MNLHKSNIAFALAISAGLLAPSAFTQKPSQPPTNQGVDPYKAGSPVAYPTVVGAPAQQPPNPSEQDFSGTVQGVDTVNRTMTIRTSDSRLVSRLTPGHPITLWAVMKQTPPISGLRDPNNRQPKSDPDAEQFTGSLVSSNQAVITVRIDSSRALTNVPVGKEVSLMVSGLIPQVAVTPAPGAPAQIPPAASATSGSAGEGVVSKSSEASVLPTGAQRITGTIEAIDPAANMVALRSNDGQQIRLPVDYNTRFTLSSAGGSLGDLKVGQHITATLSNSKTTAIELAPAPEGSASPAGMPGYQNR